MTTLGSREIFTASLARCVTSDAFVATFYRRFLASSDEVRAKFQHTDFAVQHRMLLRSLELIAAATAGDVEGLAELNARAESHDRHHLNIKRPLYELWLDALLETAREFDPEWDDSIEVAWRSVLGHAIDYMVRRY
ncbi:MAG: globin [Planctomycetota bacterium]|mgnify:CR=1 FL=1|nr:MAG: globin [Planctomycetota bacterium]REK44289.1 MAG: globin [Planctomycetota bacterium]